MNRTALILLVTLSCGTPGSAAEHLDPSVIADSAAIASVSVAPTHREVMYIAPGALQRLVRANTVVLDTPSVFTSVVSEHRDLQPADEQAITARLLRGVDHGLHAAGFEIINEPAPGSIRARLSLMDLRLQKKKRGLLAYTPIGALLKTGIDATKDITEKYDVLSTAIHIEILDGTTNEVLAQVTTIPDERSAPMDFAALNSTIRSFTSRLQRRLEERRASGS